MDGNFDLVGKILFGNKKMGRREWVIAACTYAGMLYSGILYSWVMGGGVFGPRTARNLIPPSWYDIQGHNEIVSRHEYKARQARNLANTGDAATDKFFRSEAEKHDVDAAAARVVAEAAKKAWERSMELK